MSCYNGREEAAFKMYRSINACRVCGNPDLVSIMSLGNMALTGIFPKSKNEIVTSGPLELVKCTETVGCGLVQLLQTYDLPEMYGMNYGYRSGLNSSMVSHLTGKVREILSLGVLEKGDIVIDIGSNDATTLRQYPKGEYELIGVDPTGVKFKSHYPDHIRLIPEFFSAGAISGVLDGQKAKVITSFSMFYDLEDPVTFAREIRETLHQEGVWFLEQSYLPSMLRTNSFDTICHEHLEFYALKQIIWICNKADLKVLDVKFNYVNGGSFSVIISRADSTRIPNDKIIKSIVADENALGLSNLEAFNKFESRVEEAKSALMNFMVTAKRNGKKVHGLGASTKGNVLLQYFGIGAELMCSVGEVNADKFGRLTPGSLIPIEPEDDVLSKNPDFLIVLPWHFKDFFLHSEKFKGRTLVFPLPELNIVHL